MSDFAQKLSQRGLTLDSAPKALGIHPTVLRQLVSGPKEPGGLRATAWELDLLKRVPTPARVAPAAMKTQAEQGTFF